MILEFSFDDGAKLDLRVIDLLERYGIHNRVTFYLPAEWQTYNLSEGRDPLTTDDVLDIDGKYIIGSHGVTHRLLTRIDHTDAVWEIKESKDRWYEFLGRAPESFCPPRGYSNPKLTRVIEKEYLTCRSTLVGNTDMPNNRWVVTTVHIAGNQRKEYQGTTWLEEARRLFKIAEPQEEGYFHAWGHSWEIERYNAWDDFETLLKMVTGK